MSQNLKIRLCKPDRTTIYELNDVINPVYTEIYSGINTLNFDLPYYLTDISGVQFKNPAIDLVKQFYLLFYNDEYFIIDFPAITSDDKTDLLQVKSFGLGYQLAYKRIRNLTTGVIDNPVKNITDTANLLLANTGWIVGDVNVNLNLLYRAIAISDASVLEAINNICEIWDCVCTYDTINREINFVDFKTDGIFQGLVISQNRYLKNIQCEKVNELTTKLHIYGVNDLSINAVNPNGQNFITDYTFVKTTDYMTQGMIDNLNTYEAALADSDTIFQGYLDTKLSYQATLLTKENELDVLYNAVGTGLNNIELAIEIATANGESTTELKAQRAAQRILVDAKILEIADVNLSIDGVNAQILALQSSLSISNYLTVGEISLLNDLTFESSYIDSNITAKGNTIDVLLELLAEAKKQLSIVSTPRFSANLDVVDFCSCEEVEYDKNRLKIGDIVKVKHPDVDIYIDAKVVQIEHNYDSFGLKILIANEKDLKNGFTTAQSLLKSVSGINGTISVNANSWSNGGTAGTIISNYINNAIDTTKQMIIGGGNNSVQINERGITIMDISEPQYVQRFTAGAWGLSSDGGENFTVGASKGNIHAEIITGNLIVGNTGIFEGLQLYDSGDNLVCEIGTYISSEDGITEKTGIKITNGALEIIGGVGNAVELGTSYNGVVIDSINGLRITDNDVKFRTTLNATEGFKIETSTDAGATWTPVMSFDLLGNGYFKGDGEFTGIVDASDFKINGVSILTEDDKIDANFISGSFGMVKDLLIDQLSTSDKIKNFLISNTSDVDYVYIYDQFVEFITENGASGSRQETSTGIAGSGLPLYWVDENHVYITTEVTDYPVYVYNYSTKLVKGRYGFKEIEGVDVPTIELGAGDLNGNSKGLVYKGIDGLYIEYITSSGLSRIIKLTDTGIDFSDFDTVTFTENMVMVGIPRIWIQPTAPVLAMPKDLWVDTDDYSRYDLLALTAGITLNNADAEFVTASGTFTITMPTAAVGVIKRIANIGTGLVTVSGNLNGAVTTLNLFPAESVEFIGNTTGWWW